MVKHALHSFNPLKLLKLILVTWIWYILNTKRSCVWHWWIALWIPIMSNELMPILKSAIFLPLPFIPFISITGKEVLESFQYHYLFLYFSFLSSQFLLHEFGALWEGFKMTANFDELTSLSLWSIPSYPLSYSLFCIPLY